MLLDLIFELLSDFSPMYIYLSTILSVFYVIRLLPNQYTIYSRNQLALSDLQVQNYSEPNADQVIEMIEKRNWLAIITKRIEVPDDDDDEHVSFLTLFKLIKNQGGTTCSNNLYSLSYGKQVY
ncbi:hypothetical protein [Ornithinibacillus halotolerans]|uniref:Uncharacterized protein n=1 Tax=Ornithinibacillus halotolerans TaxID=1274357 RepID=A0A916WDA1_9BACI|nr:hypothetical protein [Ornithinibacillus halotolerans]GGA89318.1 hypothetical protein GCM10008025_34940 [Ornithinibacillus halotolerans]